MSKPAPCTGCPLLNMCVRDSMPACEDLIDWRAEVAREEQSAPTTNFPGLFAPD